MDLILIVFMVILIAVNFSIFRESRRKTPNAVAFKDDERHFSDPALGVVSRFSFEKSFISFP